LRSCEKNFSREAAKTRKKPNLYWFFFASSRLRVSMFFGSGLSGLVTYRPSLYISCEECVVDQALARLFGRVDKRQRIHLNISGYRSVDALRLSTLHPVWFRLVRLKIMSFYQKPTLVSSPCPLSSYKQSCIIGQFYRERKLQHIDL
ncbi:MAG: hypothetical protein WC091_21895, partial [Sulfuricellaceae bacterium]